MTNTYTKDLNIWLKACRTNTGKSLTDSGDYYGRIYDLPALHEDQPSVYFQIGTDGIPYKGAIETAFFLNDNFELIHDIQGEFESYDEEEVNKYSSWWDAVTQFMTSKGYKNVCRGNTYNTDNDLTQNYNYNVWLPETFESEDFWYETDEAIVTLHIHTGCDVRSGYTPPYFVRARGDYVLPMTLTTSFDIVRAEDLDGNELDLEAYDSISERWGSTYADYAWTELEEDIQKWYPELTKYEYDKAVECTALLLQGDTKVVIRPYYDYAF